MSQRTRQQEWEACEPGLLVKHVRLHQRRRLIQLAAGTVGAASCVAMTGFGGWWLYLQELHREYEFSGLTCSDVRRLLPQYRRGLLDNERSRMLEEHVRRCSTCAPFRSELRQQT